MGHTSYKQDQLGGTGASSVPVPSVTSVEDDGKVYVYWMKVLLQSPPHKRDSMTSRPSFQERSSHTDAALASGSEDRSVMLLTVICICS